ncbi:MAG: putative peptidoglycan glycosyltransferase FtsW [Patescibacteria group bacterium]
MRLSGSGKTLTILVFLLTVFGLVMLSSAGVVEGQKKFNSAYYFFNHQLFYGVLPGLILFFIASRMHYRLWRKLALPILILAIGLMVMVFIPQFGLTIKGARRWVDLGFITFQPAEFLKLAVVVYLAAWFGSRGSQAMSQPRALAPFLLVLAFVALLLILQPDIKTLALVTLIGVALYFFAGAKLSHILGLILLLGVILGTSSFAPYRFNRIRAYLNPTVDKQGVAYHINQALIGVGSGGLFGVGFGQSKQKINFLPEPVGDSIFAVIVEELGFVGGAAVLALFVLLILTLVGIARASRDQFGRLFTLGLAVWIFAQMFVNIGAILNLIPLTGIPLPFFSYGSSSLITLLAGLGVALNISKH